MPNARGFDAWIIVGPDDGVFPGTIRPDREAVVRDCAAVCVLNGLKANHVRVAPARVDIDIEAAVVFNEDPEYLEKLRAANLAKRKRRVPTKRRHALQRVGGRDRR